MLKQLVVFLGLAQLGLNAGSSVMAPSDTGLESLSMNVLRTPEVICS